MILLIDDDAAVRTGLERVFANEGWHVVSAANGAEALECLTEIKPDLIITDLCMPEVNGWDMLFYESMHRPDLPIFVISGLPRRDAGGADHFAAEFFPKPLDLEGLLLAVHRRLDAARKSSPAKPIQDRGTVACDSRATPCRPSSVS